MLFNNNQLNDLLETIETFHLVFIGTNVGKDVLTKKDIVLLKKAGIDVSKFPANTLIENAFKFGVLAEALGDKNTQGLNYNEFKDYIKKGKFIPLTKAEEFALESVKQQAYHDIKNLSNKAGRQLTNIHQQISSRKQYEKIIEDKLKDTVENREDIKDMVLALGHATQDWQRDFGRISDYLMHSVYEEGRAAYLEDNYGEDVYVYKDVFPGACRHCIKLYLTGGIGSQPRIFKLSQLRKNGTNIGRKVITWLATLGPLHPWCRCTLQYVEAGYTWNPKTRSFDIPEEFVRKVKRNSTIKITIGDKTFEV